ncbi:hypothetical protein MXB_132 [Myxobolus squamalis]|nr:hypothetical protein MXB_132 [Myxobolus squamalis]
MDWSKRYPHCRGSSQSPISIKRHSSQRSIKFPTFLKFKIPTGGDILYGTLENDGKSFNVQIVGGTTDVNIF